MSESITRMTASFYSNATSNIYTKNEDKKDHETKQASIHKITGFNNTPFKCYV